MDKEQIISTLINLNFSRLEAEIYITLLGGEMSGYQISKKIEIARPSVYAALEHMFEKGIVQKIQGNSSEYKAQPPQIIFKSSAKNFLRMLFLLNKHSHSIQKITLKIVFPQ